MIKPFLKSLFSKEYLFIISIHHLDIFYYIFISLIFSYHILMSIFEINFLIGVNHRQAVAAQSLSCYIIMADLYQIS